MYHHHLIRPTREKQDGNASSHSLFAIKDNNDKLSKAYNHSQKPKQHKIIMSLWIHKPKDHKCIVNFHVKNMHLVILHYWQVKTEDLSQQKYYENFNAFNHHKFPMQLENVNI